MTSGFEKHFGNPLLGTYPWYTPFQAQHCLLFHTALTALTKETTTWEPHILSSPGLDLLKPPKGSRGTTACSHSAAVILPRFRSCSSRFVGRLASSPGLSSAACFHSSKPCHMFLFVPFCTQESIFPVDPITWQVLLLSWLHKQHDRGIFWTVIKDVQEHRDQGKACKFLLTPFLHRFYSHPAVFFFKKPSDTISNNAAQCQCFGQVL